jgi:anhydro-N-acetylmuramic acid kinase
MSYDKNGNLGRSGKVNSGLLEKLNNISYYHQLPPKSLGREWLENEFMPVLKNSETDNNDQIRTIYEHIAAQISLNLVRKGKVLITGGGAFNLFLIELIKKKSKAEIAIPDSQIINYKEALIFAFLGLLRMSGKINCYASVTGACADSSAGIIFLPQKHENR